MDIRTLTLVNLIFLFLYAAIMLVHSGMNCELKGARWFAWSNLSRGVGVLLLSLAPLLPRAFASVAGNVLLVVGLLLLHRSLAEVLGRGKTAWNLHLGVTLIVFLGVVIAVMGFGSYTAPVMLVSLALSVQMALSAVLLVSGLDRSTRVAAYGMSAILFGYALVYMTRAISLFRHADGGLTQMSSTVWCLLLVGSLLADAGTAFGFMFLSAAQLRAELTHQAERDALTGLLNRRGLQALAARSLEKSYRAAEPLSAVMLDLDGMKVANDTWGHECGDDLLRKVAKLLVTKVGRKGAVARLGGDEFLVVLPGMAEGGAMEMAEHLRTSIEGLHVQRCRPRASFGVASMTGVSWEEAVRQSDQALYQAKNAGKNQVICFG